MGLQLRVGDPETSRDVDRGDAGEQHAEDGVLGRVKALVEHRPDPWRHGGNNRAPSRGRVRPTTPRRSHTC